jgi:hypothetical protein
MSESRNNVTKIPIDLIEPDLNNPRIANYLEYYKDKGSIDLDKMKMALGADSPESSSDNAPSYESLKKSILTRGTIIQPIIVNKNSNGEMTVIEGNTRLVIYKEFKKNKELGNWDEIPAVVYEDADQNFLDSIRLQAHLVGPRPWDPYSKAKYLDKLCNQDKLPMSEIIAYCGGKNKEIQDYIKALKDMEEFYRPLCETPAQFNRRHFSAFVELQSTSVQQALGDANLSISDFSKLVKDDKFVPLQSIRSLPAILKNTEATQILFQYGAKEAKKIVDIPSLPALSKISTEQILEEVVKRIDNLKTPDYKKLSNPENPTRINFLNVRDYIEEMFKLADRIYS